MREGDRFFGRTVNLAARVAAEAGGAEILVSAALAQSLADVADVHLGPPRSVRLKGIQETQQVRLVDWGA